MDLLPDRQNSGLRMHRGCRERFPRHRHQRKTLVTCSDPGMHHGMCVTTVSWCMSGSLIRGGGENVPGIPGACATRNFAYLVKGQCGNVNYEEPEYLVGYGRLFTKLLWKIHTIHHDFHTQFSICIEPQIQHYVLSIRDIRARGRVVVHCRYRGIKSSGFHEPWRPTPRQVFRQWEYTWNMS